MISTINSGAVRSAYTNNLNDAKSDKANAKVTTKEDGTTRIEKLKESIDSGEYKVDLEAVAQKMAQDLL
ncbi:flagellar biosynthesis anti-sigma factor FlgM [Sulfurimonas sp.]